MDLYTSETLGIVYLFCFNVPTCVTMRSCGILKLWVSVQGCVSILKIDMPSQQQWGIIIPFNTRTRGFETSWNLMVRIFVAYRLGAKTFPGHVQCQDAGQIGKRSEHLMSCWHTKRAFPDSKVPWANMGGTGAETCGFDDVFPPDDLCSRPEAMC